MERSACCVPAVCIFADSGVWEVPLSGYHAIVGTFEKSRLIHAPVLEHIMMVASYAYQ